MDGDLQPALENIARLAALGRLDDAAQACAGLLLQHSTEARAWYLQSEIRFQASDYAGAIASIEHALALQPEQAGYRLQLGKCLLLAGRRTAALAAARAAAALEPESAAVLDGIGTLYSQLGDVERALAFYRRATGIEPCNPAFLFNLATAQRMQGDADAAAATCARIIAVDPQSCAARYLRADLRQHSPQDNHIGEMERLLDAGVRHWHDEMLLRFALGRECEDVGLHEHAFRHVQRACTLQRGRLVYSVDDDIDVIDRIVATHTGEQLARRGAGHACDEPIFIVGLPRTGTTLLERILSGHSRVTAAGELEVFPAALARAVAETRGGAQCTGTALVEAALAIDVAALGRAYVEDSRPPAGQGRHFIDKLPRNYLYCGLIHAALPHARIIAVERDPMDTCYAMYQSLLSASYAFSFDLQDLGRYYLAWTRLMAHWRDVLGPALHTVRYEELVMTPEAVARRVADFCDLPWEDACLDLTRRTDASTTASAIQVRRPIHRDSVGKWRPYGRQLMPLLEILRAGGAVR